MDEKLTKARLRRDMSKGGWTLLIYYVLMNLAVAVAGILEFSVSIAINGVENVLLDQSQLQAILNDGWGLIGAICIGAVLMLLWKKKEFCFHTIWQTNGSMTPGKFFAILSIFLGGQLVYSVLLSVFEWAFNLVGLTLTETAEQVSGASDTFSMFLYVGLFAPVAEEILFRGLLLRMLRPYGKRFAILATAFLFAMFHGNFVQSPYAFVIGLVLGYVAVEYSMVWAMVLHMINNMLVSDALMRVCDLLPPWMGELIFTLLLLGTAIAGVVILICKRREIAQYRREDPMHPWCVQSIFSAPGVLVFTAMMVMNMLLTISVLGAG